MKIERAWLRIIVAVIVGGIAGFASWQGVRVLFFPPGYGSLLRVCLYFLTTYSTGPIAATVLMHLLTPREVHDGHTRCGKCGYILKGLTEPRCSECGEKI